MTWKKITLRHESHDDHLNHVHDPQSPAIAMYLVNQDLIDEVRARFAEESNPGFHENYDPEFDSEAAEGFLRHLQEDSEKQVGHMEIVGPWPGMGREEAVGPPQEQIPSTPKRPKRPTSLPGSESQSLRDLFEGLFKEQEKKVQPPKTTPPKSDPKKPDDPGRSGWGGYL